MICNRSGKYQSYIEFVDLSETRYVNIHTVVMLLLQLISLPPRVWLMPAINVRFSHSLIVFRNLHNIFWLTQCSSFTLARLQSQYPKYTESVTSPHRFRHNYFAAMRKALDHAELVKAAHNPNQS